MALLRAIPERAFPDISERVEQRILRGRWWHRMGAWGASIAAIGVGLVWISVKAPRTDEVRADEASRALVQVMDAREIETAPTGTKAWLMSVQAADGTWDPGQWGGSRDYRLAVTGFAMMALVNEGTELADASLVRAMEALKTAQRETGTFGAREHFANHAIATAALLRMYETGRFPELFSMIDRAVNTIRETQGMDGVWGGNATVSVWLMDALARADVLGWRDVGGHLRRGLRALSMGETELAESIRAAQTLQAKCDVVAACCEQWVASNPISRAGGDVYAASVAEVTD